MKLPLAASAFLLALPLLSQTVPTTINYQGRLTDNTPSQTPVNAVVPMKFAIFDALTGGNQKWLEPNPVAMQCFGQAAVNVSVNQGLFNVALGGNCWPLPTPTFTGSDSVRYLEITINPGQANQEILSPRQLITATGYAHLANHAGDSDNATYAYTAESATTATTASVAPWSGITGMPAGFADGFDNGSVTSVATGAGLSGGPITGTGTVDLRLNSTGALSKTLGAGNNELGVAAAAVVPAHLSAAGSSSGQALVSTGSAVAWGTPSFPPRKFFLTIASVAGNAALTACSSGYHMASLWEIFSFSQLQYNTTLGYSALDSGPGGIPVAQGWIRTGYGSNTIDQAGLSNCAVWTSNSNTAYGTRVNLSPDWFANTGTSGYNYQIAPWQGRTQTCNAASPVWCVQD